MNTENVREHSRVQVSDYAGLMRRLIPYYDDQRDLMVTLVPFERSAPLRVLDLGCGPGLMSERILNEFPYAQVTLFDLTSEMIEACRVRFGRSDRIKYQVGDFRIDDFGSGYDVVLASLSLHHLTELERLPFAERIYKGLAPNGCLITAEVIVDESPEVRERQYELWRRHMVVQGEDGGFWYERHLAKDHPVEMSSWVSMLQRTGFVSVGCFWRYLNFAVIGGRRSAV